MWNSFLVFFTVYSVIGMYTSDKNAGALKVLLTNPISGCAIQKS